MGGSSAETLNAEVFGSANSLLKLNNNSPLKLSNNSLLLCNCLTAAAASCFLLLLYARHSS